jgi:hypothetical protein
LVPGLTEKDFDEIQALGIKLVKFIFYDYSLLPTGEANRSAETVPGGRKGRESRESGGEAPTLSTTLSPSPVTRRERGT